MEFPSVNVVMENCACVAAGGNLVLKPAESTSLTALYFAQICEMVQLPKVVTAIAGDGEAAKSL